jgi:hypothetical protein
MNHTITITLPEQIYERVKVTAQAMSLSPEVVLTESLSLFFPAFEDDMPFDRRIALAALSLLSDPQLWKIAHQTMEPYKQNRLAELAEIQKHRSLHQDEQTTLDSLMNDAQQIMLYKAEAYRILSQRGHLLFSSPPTKHVS